MGDTQRYAIGTACSVIVNPCGDTASVPGPVPVSQAPKGTQIIFGPRSDSPKLLEAASERRIERVSSDLNCRVRVTCHMEILDAWAARRDNEDRKYRIMEWTSMFSDGF